MDNKVTRKVYRCVCVGGGVVVNTAEISWNVKVDREKQRFLHQYWSRVKKAHWGVLHHYPIQHLLQNSSVPSLLSASLFTPLLLLCSHTHTFSLHLSSLHSINRLSITVWKQPIHHGLEFGGNTTLSIWAVPSSPSLLFLHPIPPPIPPSTHLPASSAPKRTLGSVQRGNACRADHSLNTVCFSDEWPGCVWNYRGGKNKGIYMQKDVMAW